MGDLKFLNYFFSFFVIKNQINNEISFIPYLNLITLFSKEIGNGSKDLYNPGMVPCLKQHIFCIILNFIFIQDLIGSEIKYLHEAFRHHN